LTFFAYKRGTGAGANVYKTESRWAEIPGALQRFEYDTDGNITKDGVWEYRWDAENRLIEMKTDTFALTGAAPLLNRRIEFRYDYLHRRVLKRFYENGSTVQTYGRRFLYDGWNLVAEYSETTAGVLDTLKRSYTWGLDIARSMTDAGGVGALLQIADHSTGKTYLPSYDGNGNIVALFDSAATGGDAGACVAIYEYSPYGEFLRCEGAYAKENPFRFSTKFTDDETGLVYYGRRYYSPSQGRFLGRDPIEEKGGLNLYGFVSNDPIDHWDLLGMEGSQYADGSGGFDDMDAKIAGHLSDARISAVLMQNKLNARADRAMEVIVANQGLRPGQMQIRSAAEAREVLEFLGIRTLTTGENGGADVLRAKLAIWAMSDPDTYQRNITRLNAVSLASSLILGAALPGFRTSAPFVAITAADAATVQALNAAARVGPGQFVGVAESMSARAAAYQTAHSRINSKKVLI